MDEERRRLLDDVDQVVRQSTTWQPDVVARYFGTVGNDDLLSRNPDEFAALMLSHFSVGDVRPVGTDVVHIDPRGTIDLVTDDMPFLVDSVSGDLLRRGHEIALLAHPQFLVQRAPDGQLLAVIDDASEAADAVADKKFQNETNRYRQSSYRRSRFCFTTTKNTANSNYQTSRCTGAGCSSETSRTSRRTGRSGS